jgi:hypothetical protein
MRERIVEYLKPIPSTRPDSVSRIAIEDTLGNSRYRVRIAIEPTSRHQQIKLIHWPDLALV